MHHLRRVYGFQYRKGLRLVVRQHLGVVRVRVALELEVVVNLLAQWFALAEPERVLPGLAVLHRNVNLRQDLLHLADVVREQGLARGRFLVRRQLVDRALKFPLGHLKFLLDGHRGAVLLDVVLLYGGEQFLLGRLQHAVQRHEVVGDVADRRVRELALLVQHVLGEPKTNLRKY
uniref:(northern house mosquito) hypothetical protein n=1 Tax=Culex pipiens TaxID=7175 RepID=A0A8D8BN45_CULPI